MAKRDGLELLARLREGRVLARRTIGNSKIRVLDTYLRTLDPEEAARVRREADAAAWACLDGRTDPDVE